MAAMPLRAITSDLVAKLLPVILSCEKEQTGKLNKNIIRKFLLISGSIESAKVKNGTYYLAIAFNFSSRGIFSIAYRRDILGIAFFLFSRRNSGSAPP